MPKDCTLELEPGEIWLGNHAGTGLPKHLASLKTARLGNQAYDIHGHQLPRNECRPLIIHRSEAAAYDRIMNARLSAIRQGTA